MGHEGEARQPSLLPYLWMLLGSLAFATMGALAHALREACPWQVIALTRSALALVFAVLLTRAAGARFVVFRPRVLWVRSIAGSLSLVSTFYAFCHLPVADVMTLTNMFPIWVALLSWPVLGEVPSGRVWLSVATGIVGVVLIQRPHLAEGNLASLVALGAGFCTAFGMLGLNRLRGIDERAIVAHFSGVSTLFCVAALFAFDRTPLTPSDLDGTVLFGLLGIGVLATAGQLMLTRAFTAGSAARVSVIALSQVPFAIAYDAVCWHRTFDAATLAGIGLVVAPTAWLMATRR
jgi:drug/metabolite transporter (DMT)-like permease